MSRSRHRSKLKKAPGLPADQLFQHLKASSVPRKVDIGFLAKNVWWWRIPDIGLQMWIENETEGWPRCELYELSVTCLPSRRPRTREEARDCLLEYCKSCGAEIQPLWLRWWEHEIDAAKGYELDARDCGSYPRKVPYILLTRKQRDKWKNNCWQMNLNSAPAFWRDGHPPYNFDPDKLTALFPVNLGEPTNAARVSIRVNLRHGNGWLARGFALLILAERKRLGIPDTAERSRKDPARIREFRQFVTKERKRLKIPNPKHEGHDRRPLERSWADIENIDIKTHCKNEKTTPRTRQRESATRRKLISLSKRQREIARWKLTILKQAPPRGSVTRAKLKPSS